MLPAKAAEADARLSFFFPGHPTSIARIVTSQWWGLSNF
jgi:hypothetical protein